MNIRSIVLPAAVFLAPAFAAAQIPLGPEFRVDTSFASLVSAFPEKPRAATMTPDGRFIIVWQTAPLTPGGHDVRARRYGVNGRALAPEFVVNSYTTGTQRSASIASDDAGNFVVVWTSEGQDGSQEGVFGQKFDAAGAPLGAEFRVNETTLGNQLVPEVAMRPDGAFVVAWTSYHIFARRYDASGLPVRGEFQVNTYTPGGGLHPSVDFDGAGNFVVAWEDRGGSPALFNIRARRFDAAGSPQGADFVVHSAALVAQKPKVARSRNGSFAVAWRGAGPGDFAGIFMRHFDPNGMPLSPDVLVNTYTLGSQENVDVDADADGDVVVSWQSEDQDGSQRGIYARRFTNGGIAAGPEFRVNTYTTDTQNYASIANDTAGNFLVTWRSFQDGVTIRAQRYAGGLAGVALAVDAGALPTSDGNGVLEPGETVVVAPSWLNATPDLIGQAFAGSASGFIGPGTPGNPTYSLVDPDAAYPLTPPGATSSCAPTGDCYRMGISVPATRPAAHWDATFREDLSPPDLGAVRNWPLHVGDSFADVPRSNAFYRFVETLLHHGVTGGCTATAYCPAAATTREQMAVFVLVAKEGGYQPPACTSALPRIFADVPTSHPFCAWIEELARRGVVGGCGGNDYCPGSAVSREQMSVFVLRTLDPAISPPACGTPMFSDVPASNLFCRWIEELARRGVVTGCGGGAYCPTSPVTREQMGVFLSLTFGLLLYGP